MPYNRVSTDSGYPWAMFGPLNGVRVALVAAAAIAALIALGTGFTLAGLVLLVAIAVHGLGWLYLYRQRPSGGHEDDPRAPHSPI